MPDTRVFVPVCEIFPDLSSDFKTFQALVQQLSRTDALFWCARLNLIISNPANSDHLAKQQYALDMCFCPEEIERINRYTKRHGGVSKIAVFFRGQLLELARWVSVLSNDHRDDGSTFENPDVQRTFAQAALIVSELWGQRIYGTRMSLEDGVDAARDRALGAIRQSLADTSSGMDPLLALGRGKGLIAECLPEFYPALTTEFQSKTGLSLEDYYLCLSAIMTHFLNVTPENAVQMNGGIFNVNKLCRETPGIEPLVSAYLRLEAQTPDELRDALSPGTKVLVPEAAVDYRALRQRPILCTPDGRGIVTDPVFYAERASVGPLFVVSQGADRSKANKIFGAFGNAFERYSGDILSQMYPRSGSALVNRLTVNLIGYAPDGSEVQIADACLNDATELVLFESKAVWIRDDCVLAEDSTVYLEELKKKYGITGAPNERPKGVAQLARAISKLASGQLKRVREDLSLVERIYPVLLVHDSLLSAPVHSQFLAREFAAALEPDEAPTIGDMRKGRFRVTPLILMTIEDLENLETSIEEFALRKLLSDYSASCPDRIESLGGFIARSDYAQRLRYSQSVARRSLGTMRDTLAALQRAVPQNESTM